MKRELKIILTLMIFGMFLLPSSIIANKVNNAGFENEEMIIIHNSFDGREYIEELIDNISKN